MNQRRTGTYRGDWMQMEALRQRRKQRTQWISAGSGPGCSNSGCPNSWEGRAVAGPTTGGARRERQPGPP